MRGARCKGFRLVAQPEPLREENADGSIGWVFHHIDRHLNIEGIFIIGKGAAVEGARSDLDNGSSLVDDFADDLNGFASVRIDNRSDLRFGLDDVTNAEGGMTVERAETIRKVDRVEEVTVGRLGENLFDDSLEGLFRIGTSRLG